MSKSINFEMLYKFVAVNIFQRNGVSFSFFKVTSLNIFYNCKDDFKLYQCALHTH